MEKTQLTKRAFYDNKTKTEEEILKFYHENIKDFNTCITTIGEVLYEMSLSSSGCCVVSFPDVEDEIKEYPKDTKVRMYSKMSDGWGCVYENIYLIEII